MINWVEGLTNFKKNDTCQFPLIHTIGLIIAHLNQRRDSQVERAETKLEFRENRIDEAVKNFFLENFTYYWQDWNGSIISHITAVIAFIDRAHTCIFPVINKNSRGDKSNIKVKRWSNHTRRDFKDLGRNLIKASAFRHFKIFNVNATFSSGILENRKAGELFCLLLRYVLMLLEDLFVDSAAKVGPMFTKKSLNDSEIC